MTDTSIEWTRGDDGMPGKTWNPIRGCSRVSLGCQNCYAERIAARFSDDAPFANATHDLGELAGPQPFHGFATRSPARWTGRVELIPEKLDEPLRWRKPRRVFVNSMSDLFHEALTNDEISKVFAVMALAPQHTFQILTKRPERARKWFSPLRAMDTTREMVVKGAAWEILGHHPKFRHQDVLNRPWPLPNVWLGVSCEDQKRADERIPLLLQTPAAVRFVSLEPLLGAINIFRWCENLLCREPLDWVIVGGESGPGARNCEATWIRDISRQCEETGTACFVKQLGDDSSIPDLSRKGGDPSEWPEDLRVREWPT